MKSILIPVALFAFPVLGFAQQPQQADQTNMQTQILLNAQVQPMDPAHFCYFGGLAYSEGAELNKKTCTNLGTSSTLTWDRR